MDTLNAMERIGTDNKDRPVEEIVIEQALVFTDPYAEVDEQVNFPLQFSLFCSISLSISDVNSW
jgi:hypothetical protein